MINNTETIDKKLTIENETSIPSEMSDAEVQQAIEDALVDDTEPWEYEGDYQPNNTEAIDRWYFNNIHDIPVLSPEDELKLTTAVKAGDHDARKSLVYHNLRLAAKIACYYRRVFSYVDLMDLLEMGNMGLFKAADRFDPELGYKFSTYATWWIRQSILRDVANQEHLVRIPVHANETMVHVNRAQRDLSAELQREPTISEIAERTRMTEREIRQCLDMNIMFGQVTSLDRAVIHDGEEATEIWQFLAAPDDVEDEVVRTHVSEAVMNVMRNVLSERELGVLLTRFGFTDGIPHTLEYTGRIYGVTRERIRQIEAKALRKLRSGKYRRYLRDLLY